MNRIIKLTLISVFALLSLNSFATITFEDGAFPELVTSGRALAMGNAFAAKSDDHNSVFYNPAGLGSFRGWQVHLMNFHIETNKYLMNMAGGGNITDSFSNIFKAFGKDGTRELLLENRGKMSHARFNFYPNISSRFLSMGYMLSKQMRSTIGVETDAKFEYADRLDHGPVIAGTIPIWGGIFKIGASFIYLMRKEAVGEADRDQAIDLQPNDYKKGGMAHLTTGAKLTFPVSLLPTFSATLHNSTNGKFQKLGGSGEPDPIKQNLVGAFSITPQIGKAIRVHMEIDYKDMLDRHNISMTRRLGLGLEIDFARTMFLRLGYGDGFGSGGIGLRTKRVVVDVTTYAVDSTASEFRGKEDRRFAFSVSSGI